MRTDETAVLIAGADLAGLLLAGDLAAAGLTVTVLSSGENEAGPVQVTLSSRTLEQLDARGIGDALASAGLKVHQLALPGAASLDLSGLPTRYPFALIVPGSDAGRLMASRALAAGATIFPGTQITGISQGSDHVVAQAADALGTPCTFRARYLVCARERGQGWRAAHMFSVGDAAHRGNVAGVGDAAHRGNVAGRGGTPDRGLVAGQGQAAGWGQVSDGPGADAGLQDAANLSWKLIAVLRDGADPGLLGSYGSERSHARRHADRQAAWLARIGPAGLRAALRFGPAADYAARAVSGLTLSYPGRPGEHWLTGRRAPDAWLADGTGRRLYEALREQRMILLASPGLIDTVTPLLDLWTGRAQAAPADGTARLMLVRPDGYVAWASDSAAPARRYAGLRAALTKCCGPAARAASHAAR